MAYRRRHGLSRSSTFQEDHRHPPSPPDPTDQPLNSNISLRTCYSFSPSSSSSSSSPSSSSLSSNPPSLAAQALRASAARRDPSLSFAYGDSAFASDHLASKESQTIVDSKTADLGTQVMQKGSGGDASNEALDVRTARQQLANAQSPTNLQQNQLKASRDVAMATAAKAKLLLRELKTVKADLAFAKARCAQLEEENKLLRDKEGSEKGQNRADDDLIRLQLETLLAEKARLANETEICSRENRILREIVEYHQLSMQDVVYLDEGMEEVSEYPFDSDGVTRVLSISSTPVDRTPSTSPPRPSPSYTLHQENKSTITVSEHNKDPAN